VGFKL